MGIPVPENFSAPAVTADVNQAKDATLRALASGGTNAVQQLAQAQTYSAGVQQQATTAAVAGARSPAQASDLSGAAAAPAANFNSVMQSRTGAQQDYYSGMSSLIGDYAGRVNQAIPLEQAVTQQGLNSLQAVAQERAADRAQAREMAQLQRQEVMARLAATQRAASAKDDPNSPSNRLTEANINRVNAETDHLNNPGKYPRQPSAAEQDQEEQRNAQIDAVNRVADIPGKGTRAGDSLRLVMGNSASLADALTVMNSGIDSNAPGFQTPNGKKLDKQYMDWLVTQAYGDPSFLGTIKHKGSK